MRPGWLLLIDSPAVEVLLIAVALFLAFGNGGNDNFKGFATVWGADSLSYRQALMLATVATAAGSLLSLYLAHGLLQQFSGKGLLPQTMLQTPQFLVSVGLGAALTVIIATRVGLPISTTHALIGGLVGAGLAASPQALQFAKLGQTFVLPLLLSPILAAGLGLLSYRTLRLGGKQSIGNTKADCACLVPTEPVVAMAGIASPNVNANATGAVPRLMVAATAECDRQGAGGIRMSIPRMLDRLHIFSAGLICFARAVNDTPKLAALLAASQLVDARESLALIAVAMVFTTMASIGLPGLNGFVGEMLSLAGMFRIMPIYAVIGTSGVVLGAWYMLTMVQQGRILLATLYVLTSVFGGLLAVWLGIVLASWRS